MVKRYNNTRAQLIPEDKVEQRVSTIRVRSSKNAFVINKNLTLDHLLNLIEYNSVIWGGFYSLFIPTNGKTLRDDWMESLCNYDLQSVDVKKIPKLIIEQLEKVIKIATRIKANIVFLFVLAREVPDYIEKELMRLKKEINNSIAIHLIIGSEIEKGFKTKTRKVNNKDIKTECTIDDFLPDIQNKRRGWIRKPGKRISSF